MNRFKKNFLINLAQIVLVPIIIFSAIYIYDPLQLFHKPWLRDQGNFHNENMRLQDAGIINSYGFDSIIIGNSLLENTSCAEASSSIGGTFVNLSISGSNNYERDLIISYVLKNKKIKTVLNQLDSNISTSGHGGYSEDQWNYLYDDSRLNDFKIYLTKKYLLCTASFSTSEHCLGRQIDLDMPVAWFKLQECKVLFGGLDNWIAHREKNQHAISTIEYYANKEPAQQKDLTNKQKEEIHRFYDKYILNNVESYPEVQFVLIVPPVSNSYNAVRYYDDSLRTHFFVLAYLVEQSSKLKNLKVYGFEDKEFTTDIANYKDLSHYSEQVNTWMLTAIASGEGLLTPDNFDEYVQKVTEHAKAFDFKTIYEYIQKKIAEEQMQS